MPLPLFPVTSVGSWPRPAALLRAARTRAPELESLRDAATVDAIRAQEEAGVDIVVDGEQRRDNFFSFVCERLDGVELMSMAKLLDHVDDKAAFEQMLEALDVPAFAIKNPVVTGKVRRAKPLVLDDYKFLRAHTTKPVKVTLPGPYLLSRSSYVESLTRQAYDSREEMADDFVALLRAEIIELAAQGVEFVQLDEPVLTEVVHAGKSKTHTFM